MCVCVIIVANAIVANESTSPTSSAQESKDLYSKTSSYELDHDHAYQHTQSQKEYERNAEKEAKESLLQFARSGKHPTVRLY